MAHGVYRRFVLRRSVWAWAWLCLLLALPAHAGPAPRHSPGPGSLQFNDQPLTEDIVLPDWFKLSFLELRDDLDEAIAAGKRGLIVYFGQKDCPYCKEHLEKNWGNKDIVAYTRKYFDVVAIDVRGQRLVTDMDGIVSTEKALAIREKTNFTPSIVFYNQDAREVLRLSGYHPPYQFAAALEYVADGHYRQESFRHYLARGEAASSYGQDQLNDREFFAKPPYNLDRSRFPAEQPLVVFFEQRHCHACDVLHGGVFQRPAIRQRLHRFEAVQLDMWADTPVVTPGGRRTTARRWADRLGLYYAPTLIFYDKRGREIIRVDSVVQFNRLRGVLDYVLSGDFRRQPNFRLWRQRHGGAAKGGGGPSAAAGRGAATGHP